MLNYCSLSVYGRLIFSRKLSEISACTYTNIHTQFFAVEMGFMFVENTILVRKLSFKIVPYQLTLHDITCHFFAWC